MAEEVIAQLAQKVAEHRARDAELAVMLQAMAESDGFSPKEMQAVGRSLAQARQVTQRVVEEVRRRVELHDNGLRELQELIERREKAMGRAETALQNNQDLLKLLARGHATLKSKEQEIKEYLNSA